MRVVALLLLVLPAFAWADTIGFAGGAFFRISSVDQVSVPDVVGLDLAAADTALEGEGLDTGAISTRCSDEAEDDVISQNPVSGVLVDIGSLVDLVASNGVACEGGRMKTTVGPRITIE